MLRLQQLLAVTHYLPLRWQPADAASAPAPNSLAALARPPAGHWTWAYPDVPSGLRSFWDPGTYTVLTEGAVMAFEHDHGLAVDGIAGPHVWRALLQAAARHQVDTAGYSYVSIRESSPEMLSLWSNGKIVLTSETNTGIAASPTAIGTWPVYARFVSQDMKGTDPNGQPYNDPNVPYVNYFHGGDAIHGFVRASYGYPQSLGCAELPVPAAAKAWHYIQYGTLVTVET
ncbi:L,D-transpeptidase family protein [Alicyclobacillus cycloheptanicus]|uniref:Peptidoglycan hydrolase-like protein with peptidoglycan-binding domain n=1 Tax=Alicyclobacillus cycloheptanicus TaxID=1457 RepID=A0ABT9XH31_9BACL|nr:L,D-transpeptidase family protein [Alicyclobacillus cycloheptanicus]MDQ0189606.1 peptidoglycan hydrolase-like protein with peptidoglycan-binding domain [Alicyclobacillus cycloheptanicus]